MSQVGVLLGLLARPGHAARRDHVPAYERAFAETVLGSPQAPALAFWRGRVALWALLRAAGVRQGDEVIVPVYTCETVPITVKFAGARCAYADVGEGSFNATPETIAAAVTPRTRAILCQHTYGVAAAPAAVRDIAGGAGAVLIEDCCQLVAPGAPDGGAGRAGAAAFFSTQWSKPFSTGLGGMAVFRDAALYEAARAARDGFPRDADRRRARSLAFQVLLYALTVRPWTRPVIAAMYRWAQRAGCVRGTTTVEEYGDAMPADYLASGLNVQAALGLGELARWPANVEHRRRLTALYLSRLAAAGAGVWPPAPDDTPLWAVPLLVENREEVLREASRAGLPMATWFDATPVHVAPATAARYDYRPGQCPRAERFFAREIHLVTGPAVSPARAEAAVDLLARRARLAPIGEGTAETA
jgi:dTDP-4-amino-4,6-dideoxygalactose transaminase